MARQLWALTLLGLVGAGAGLWPGKLESFRSETELNHLVVDNASGVVYLGAVNALYQLSADLRLEQQAATGPALDHKKCTPPIEASQCHEAVLTNNVNQLLLLDPPGARLVECGSLFKGICALRSLANISTRLFYEDGSGEKSFVASNDESVATVGLVSATDSNGERVLFVGKGNGPHDNGVIVSTRLLDRAHGREAFEAYTDHATYKAGYLSTNTQQFVAAFEDSRYVFFLFNQQDKHPPQNRTLLARMCKQDPYYYSYLEMDLQCLDRSDAPATAFSTCLAASVATSGAGRVLYAVFSRDVRRGGGPRAGLCLFPLEEVHAKMQAIRDACYTDTREAGRDIFYKPFHGEIQCGGHLLGASESFLCGSEHLPYPLGSREGLTANAVLQRGGLNLTAVTVTTENSHTIAFLGTSDGQVLKVYLAPDGSSAEYGSILVERNKRVKQDLVLSADLASLYAMTHHKVFRLPVQECLSYVACAQCLRSQDPYCGWCVVEGRCTRRAECPRAEESGHWLWSREESCVAVTGAQPQNMSRRAKGEVQLTVSPLPALGKEDGLLCLFGDSPPHAARVEGDTVICDSPSSIPSTPPGQDHVAMNIQLLFKQSSVFLTSHLYPFYDCRKAMSLAENLPCISCASNRWTCQWDLRYHECREASPNPEDGIVPAHMEDSCPQFLNPSPLVIPMNHETEVTFQGKNLDTVKSPSLQCSGQSRCVYEALCSNATSECPPPVITRIQPETGPLGGGIRVTILGSNLGVRADDVKRVTVAGQDCTFEPGRYSVSTRIVCAIKAAEAPFTGGVEVDISGKLGHSPPHVQFTYQQPQPLGVEPKQGPQAGGTTLTISGTHLDTGSEEDVRVTLSGVPCKVTQFGAQLQCVTGPQVALGELPLEVHYGGSHVPSPGVTFTYRENPVLLSFQPLRSFVSGGRSINVTGQGFSLIQRFAMVVIAEPLQSWQRQREAGPLQPITVVGTEYEFHNDSRVVFLSPAVPEEPEAYNLTVLIQMDGHRALLRTEAGAFEYVADPTFENFTGGVRKQVNKLIHAQGTNLNKAMTLHEAKAFVGAECCVMKTLTETDLYCEPPEVQPPPKRRQKRDTAHNLPEFIVKFGSREWVLGRVEYDTRVSDVPLSLILPLVMVPMVVVIAVSVYCYRRKSQQAEREYEKIKSQLEGLEESVRDRCKKEFTDLMIEMEDQTSDVHEAGIPVLDYKTYTDRVFFLPSKDGDKDVMITGKLDIPESRRPVVEQALYQFSNLLNSKSFLINFIHTLENQREFSARAKVYFASLLTVALHGKLEYYTDIMRTLFLELMEQYVVAKNPKLMLRRSETVVERMLSNWMSICLYQYLKDSAGEPLYKLFKAIKHQVEKGPVDAVQKKAKYTLNDTGLLGDDVEYAPLTVSVIVQDEGVDAIPVKVLNCDTISQVKEKIIDQVYRTQPCSRWPKADSVVLEWRPGSTAQILSDLDLTSQREGRWKRINTLMHYNVRDGATLILSKVGVSQQPEDSQQDLPGERHALLEEENRVWHLVRPTEEVEEGKCKRGSVKEKERTKAITEIYLTRLLSVKGTLQQFVDNFFQSVLAPEFAVPPAVKYFFDFLDEQAEKHDIKDEDTIHIWKTNSLPLRFWVNILKNPHFIFDVHVHEVVDASLSVIAQTFMDACTRTEHKLSRDSPSNKLLYAKEISTYKKMVEDYYKGIRQMVQVSDQDMNTHLAEISRAHTDSLNTLVALHQLYQYTQKYYDEVISALEEDPAAQKMQLAFRLQQIAAALENKVTDL
ncbi:plexin-B2 [Pteropus medius]|uniref:plexin-B2 n=1 Tax=Pteropus vampyrus TaxID=132908 RepID=UPI00196BACFF|nr:plexin-B2 [Pteropus giganteus]